MKSEDRQTFLIAANIAAIEYPRHPLNAISKASESKEQYYRCADRFHAICGLDNIGLSQEKMVCDLIACAEMVWP